jgi:hypothetical protein
VTNKIGFDLNSINFILRKPTNKDIVSGIKTVGKSQMRTVGKSQ